MIPCYIDLYRDDDLLGGMWAVAATVFVSRPLQTKPRSRLHAYGGDIH